MLGTRRAKAPSPFDFLSRRGLIGRLARSLVAAGAAGGASGRHASAGGHQEGTASMGTTGNGTIGLGIVGLIVRDLAASLDFYRRLGLDIPPGVTGSNYRLRLPNGQVFFWDDYATVRSFDPGWRPSAGNRRVVLEFGFASPEALDATYAALIAAGHEGYLAPFDVGARYALVKDPDGNEIGLRYPLS
jgi:catechol 2,3-dioxygenase-like lactoylglutathione lyase family enzyme